MQIEPVSTQTYNRDIQEPNENKNQCSQKSIAYIQSNLRKSKRIAKISTINKEKKTHIKRINKQNISQKTLPLKSENYKIEKKTIKKIDNQNNFQSQLDNNDQLMSLFNDQLKHYGFTSQNPSSSTDSSMIQQLLQNSINQPQANIQKLLSQVKTFPILFSANKLQYMKEYLNKGENYLLKYGEEILKNQNLKYNQQKNQQNVLQKYKQKQKQNKLYLKNYLKQSYQITYSENFTKQARTRRTTNDKFNISKVPLLQQQRTLMEIKKGSDLRKALSNPQFNQSPDMKILAIQLILLYRCFKSNKQKLNQIYRNMQIKQQRVQSKQTIADQPQSITTNNINSLDYYIKCLIKKNIINTFNQQTQIFYQEKQIWNYFKQVHFRQQTMINEGLRDMENYQQVETESQYLEYIKRMKNKKFIHKPTLPTVCTACFSNHSQRCNPIRKCPECKFRVHKNCIRYQKNQKNQRKQQKCDRCLYKKTGTNMRTDQGKCFICMNQTYSLMLFKIKGNKFVHNFCMFVHNLWNVEGEKLVFDDKTNNCLKNKQTKLHGQQSTQASHQIKQLDSLNKVVLPKRKMQKLTSIKLQRQISSKSNIKQESNNKSQNLLSSHQNSSEMLDENINSNNKQSHQCKFCLKSNTNEQFLKSCRCCNSKFHILCAYLQGCKIQIQSWKNDFDISLRIACCSNGQNSEKFQQMKVKIIFCRKYKLNYERQAFNYKFQAEQRLQRLKRQEQMVPQQSEQLHQQNKEVPREQFKIDDFQTSKCQQNLNFQQNQ